MSILISLLSAQRMQNIIPLLQRGYSFEQVIFIISAENERPNPYFERVGRDIIAALEERVTCQIYPKPVAPMLPAATKMVCQEVIHKFGRSHNVMVNITGGTKPMSIGAYQAALETGTSMLYVDTQAEQMIQYDGAELTVYPFDLKSSSVREYLRAHGREVDERETEQMQPTSAELEFGSMILYGRPKTIEAALGLRKYVICNKVKARISLDLQHPRWRLPEYVLLFDILESIGYARSTEGRLILSAKAKNLLTGGRWLEMYVFCAMQIMGQFTGVEFGLQLAGVKNDLDAACTFNAKLGIVECKSSVYTGSGTAILNRLSALKETLAGTFGKTFLVTAQREADLSEPFKRRAGEYISKIITWEELERVEQVIHNEMAWRGR